MTKLGGVYKHDRNYSCWLPLSRVHNIQMTLRQILDALLHFAPLRQVVHGCLRALAVGIVFYFLIYLLERASGGKTEQYRSRGFLRSEEHTSELQSHLNL